MKPNPWILCLIVVLVAWRAGIVGAQTAKPKSYSDYYSKALGRGVPAAAATNPGRYTYNRVFYHNPAVSPYSNLLRASPKGKTAYQAYVRPEEQRRRAQTPQADFLRTKQGQTSRPSSSAPSQYHNHYYGGRERLGLR